MKLSDILALANMGSLFAVVIYYLYIQRKDKRSEDGPTKPERRNSDAVASDIAQLRQERHDFFLTHGKDLEDFREKLGDVYQQHHSTNNYLRNLAEAIRTDDPQLRRDIARDVITGIDKEKR